MTSLPTLQPTRTIDSTLVREQLSPIFSGRLLMNVSVWTGTATSITSFI